MKKVKLNSKLSLNKETVTKLNDDQMKNVNGGLWTIWTTEGTCSRQCSTTDVCCKVGTIIGY